MLAMLTGSAKPNRRMAGLQTPRQTAGTENRQGTRPTFLDSTRDIRFISPASRQ
jgi:hypothetical protein